MGSRIKNFLLFICSLIFSSAVIANNTPINFMTYNIGCLPSPLGVQINGGFLKPNIERVQAIVNVINHWNATNGAQGITPPNMIGFEEAFDPNVRALLKEKLSTYYPYNSGETGQKPLNAGSGLLFFSQYPILEITFHPYTNIMAGDEWLANKGYITAKLKYNNEYFVTVIMSHFEAGDAIFKEEQSKEATTSFRRGEQMGHVYAEIQTLATEAPKGYEHLKYLKTFVMGDFNSPLNSERQQKSISDGLSSYNHYKAGQVKYPGQYWLFSILKNTTPNNFMEVRVPGRNFGDKKVVDANLLQQAARENKFTGSFMPEKILTKNKNDGSVISRQTTEFNIIDGIFATLDGVNGDMQTQILSMNEYSQYRYAMSDHLAMIGRFTPAQ